MFEKREQRVYRGVKRDQLFDPLARWWSGQGFYVYQRGPYHVSGESYHSKIGLKREFEMRLDEHEGSTFVDLSLRARITEEGAVGGAVVTVLFWPAALLGGAISYSEYESDAQHLMYAFWSEADRLVSHIAQGTTPPLAAPTPPEGVGMERAPPSHVCTSCGAALQTEWKVCPYCGTVMKSV